MNKEILRRCGIDYDKGVERCMDDVEFYETLLVMFLKDDTIMRARDAFEKKDYEALFRCMHELKGVCGNVAALSLYEAVCPLVELLRNGVPPDVSDLQIATMFASVFSAYSSTIDAISFAASE